mmetsp:Transcript_27203/g.33009  ORF Transcript_27203/g.33009 Transcript_27203/m.33009 type:complete len:630 (+) Transcript_27203:1385-3274(+)
MTSTVKTMVDVGAIYAAPPGVIPTVVSSVTVAYRDAGPGKEPKKRFIWNGRYVNSFLIVPKFKYEGLYMVPDLLERGGSMWSFDLLSGYYHVELHPDFHQYVAFEWEGVYYYFAVLPFGLAIAPYCFCKLTGELTKRWRSLGIRLIHYVDDFIFFGTVAAVEAGLFLQQQRVVLHDLELSGFMLSESKTVKEFTTSLVALGFGIDSVAGHFFCPEQRWIIFQALLGKLVAAKRVTARQLARVAGKAISFQLAVGKVARMFTREMYFCIETASAWDYYFECPPEVVQELQFWAGLSRLWFTTVIWPVYSRVNLNLVWTDAGSIGWGGHAELADGSRPQARGFLTMEEREQSSTMRELIAILQVLRSFVQFVAGTVVHLYTDSQAAYHIITAGASCKSHLHRIGVSLFWYCVEHGIRLDVSWIPRDLNQLADHLAGIYDRDDWRLNPDWFRYLDGLWGRHTIDRFATHLNNLLDRFNSAWYCPGTAGVNCLRLLDWKDENNWCNPPFKLIGELVRVLRAQRARATVIVPYWTRQHWWPLLSPDGQHFSTFVVDVVELPAVSIQGVSLFLPGAGRANEAYVGPPSFRVLALRVDFTRRRSVPLRVLGWSPSQPHGSTRAVPPGRHPVRGSLH